MKPYFNREHDEFRESVREFARSEIAPVAAEYDRSGDFPWPTVRKMAERRLLGIPWDVEVGGAGLDTISFVIAVHELAKADASHAITVSAHTTLATGPLLGPARDAAVGRLESGSRITATVDALIARSSDCQPSPNATRPALSRQVPEAI